MVTLDYSAMFEAARFKRIDVGYYGPMPYVFARSKAEIEPLAALVTNGKTGYLGCIIASKAGWVKTMADVRGKTFGFTDPASTAGHLLSRRMLLKLGMEAGIRKFWRCSVAKASNRLAIRISFRRAA